MWEEYKSGLVYIGTRKIASRLGFAVTRFYVVTVIFLKNHGWDLWDFWVA